MTRAKLGWTSGVSGTLLDYSAEPRSIAGWVGGNMEDALRFNVLTGVMPRVETFPLELAALVYDKMITSQVHFRSVLRMDA